MTPQLRNLPSSCCRWMPLTENLLIRATSGAAPAARSVGGLARLLPLDQNSTGTSKLRVTAPISTVGDRLSQLVTACRTCDAHAHNPCRVLRGPAARDRRYASTIRSPSGIKATA